MRQRGRSDTEAISLELLSGFFMILGLSAWAYLFISINTDDAIKEATRNNDQSIVLAFLDSLGITLPLLIIAFGGAMFYLGTRLRQRTISAARWAQVALVWLVVGAVVLMVVLFINGGEGDNPLVEESFSVSDGISAALPPALMLIPLGISLAWLNHVIDTSFEGEETLGSANARVAWNLLIPTVVVLIIVAARPLEETFITSLTDKRFAGTDPIKFIGVENYQELLTFRVDTVECKKEEGSDECSVQARTGDISWDSIDTEKLREGYRTATVISVGGDSGLAISGKDSAFLEAIGNTLRFTFVSVLLELLLGLLIAQVVNSNFPGRGLMRTAMLVPWAIPTVVSARLWDTMLRDNPSGIINKIALDLGILDQSKAWLADQALMMPAIIAVDVWKTAPFMALLILAGLQTIPSDLYEAAAVDGAGKVRQFFSITLPLLRPTIAVALVFRTLDALRAFDVFQVLVGDQIHSMATYNHEQLIQNQNGGYASAIGVVIFVMILIFTVIYVRSLGIEND